MASDDVIKLISNVGLPGVLLLVSLWFFKTEAWPWFKTEWWPQRIREIAKRLENEQLQSVALTKMEMILSKMETALSTMRDVAFSTQLSLEEHRRETKPAIENIGHLMTEVNVLKESARRAKRATDEIPKAPKAPRTKKGTAAKT